MAKLVLILKPETVVCRCGVFVVVGIRFISKSTCLSTQQQLGICSGMTETASVVVITAVQ